VDGGKLDDLRRTGSPRAPIGKIGVGGIGVRGPVRTRWRRDQRLRQRLTHSGRATLAALAVGVLVGLTSGLWLASAVGARSVERVSLSQVAAAPPETAAPPEATA
jgi:hypothetical protein